jgi:hypothetical protein
MSVREHPAQMTWKVRAAGLTLASETASARTLRVFGIIVGLSALAPAAIFDLQGEMPLPPIWVALLGLAAIGLAVWPQTRSATRVDIDADSQSVTIVERRGIHRTVVRKPFSAIKQFVALPNPRHNGAREFLAIQTNDSAPIYLPDLASADPLSLKRAADAANGWLGRGHKSTLTGAETG